MHTKPQNVYEKLEAAWHAGCRHFDGVLNGFGGCPMTGYELLGNVNTLDILNLFEKQTAKASVDFSKARTVALEYPSFDSL